MTRHRHVKWLLLLFCAVLSASYSYGQATPAAQHRWSGLAIKFSGEQAKKYAPLPEADYTPLLQLESWAANKAMQQYAEKVHEQFTMQCMLLVDDNGFIREIEVLKTGNTGHADAIKGLLLNTRTAGPSFVRNKPVTCYVPCAVKIDARQAIIY